MKKLTLFSLAAAAWLLVAASAFAAEHTYTVSMSGKQEKPKGDPDGKGTAKIKIEASKGELCYRLSWSGIGTPTASHIHSGSGARPARSSSRSSAAPLSTAA